MNQADTAWMLMSTALVLLMTPALAFFYGGLVRSKNALNTMMMSFISLGFVGVLWALLGYSLAFTTGNDWLGDMSNAFLSGVGLEAKGTIPHALFMAFQGTFAIITAALISGAIVERMRFTAYTLFITLWAVLIYGPIAHWVWSCTGVPGADPIAGCAGVPGFLRGLGAVDFAGGTVVHISAGCGVVAGSRRWARSISRAARSCMSMPLSPRLPRCSPSGSVTATVRCRSFRTTFRSCCSAPASCGLGGSVSTPAVRWPRARLPVSRS